MCLWCGLMMPHTHQEGMKRFTTYIRRLFWGQQGSPLKMAWESRQRRLDWGLIMVRGWARLRVPTCRQGLGGGTQAFPSACPDVGQREEGRWGLKAASTQRSKNADCYIFMLQFVASEILTNSCSIHNICTFCIIKEFMFLISMYICRFRHCMHSAWYWFFTLATRRTLNPRIANVLFL